MDCGLDSLSQRLYQYLCNEVVGSEQIVKYRRLFFKVLDDIINSAPCLQFSIEHISSGSKAEGLDLPGSDFDRMLVHTTWFVHEKYDFCLEDYFCNYQINVGGKNYLAFTRKSIKNLYTGKRIVQWPLLMDTDHSAPGFAMLTVPPAVPHSVRYPNSIETPYGRLISNRKFKLFHKNRNTFDTECLYGRLINSEIVIHGPCLSDTHEELDIAYCYRCENWPKIAGRWILRYRPSGWPSADIVENITQQGILFVPIGSKISPTENNELEWRISFSVAEKVLIHSFNHTQFLCYALLKIILKEIIKKNITDDVVLCSYYMKTVMFWTLEEADSSLWKPENLIYWLLQCIKRLTYWLQLDCIPNYFIPENNMIEGKVLERTRLKIVSLLESLYLIGWNCLLECQSLKDFIEIINENTFSLMNTNNIFFSKAVYPLFAKSEVLFRVVESGSNVPLLLESHISRCIFQLYKHKQSKRLRDLFLSFFLEINRKLVFHFDWKNFNGPKRNRYSYLQDKKVMHHILISSYRDAASAWLLLAFFFCVRKQYVKALTLLDHVISVCSPDKLFISSEDYLSLKDLNAYKWMHGSFFRQCRKNCVKTLDAFMANENFFKNSDIMGHGQIRRQILFKEVAQCPLVVLANYLRFLSCHYLGNTHERQESLLNLLSVLDNNYEYCIEKKRTLARSFLFLGDAFATIKDYKMADKCLDCVLKLIGYQI